MTLEPDPALRLDLPQASAFKPLLWLIVAAALAVLALMFAPVPPL